MKKIDPYFDELYRSIRCPEGAFNLYLCPSDFNPLELTNFQGHAVPSILSEAMVHLLFKLEEDSGFATLKVETAVFKKGKLSVVWESGTSRRGYIDEADLKALEQLVRTHLQNQLMKYRSSL